MPLSRSISRGLSRSLSRPADGSGGGLDHGGGPPGGMDWLRWDDDLSIARCDDDNHPIEIPRNEQ